MKYIVINEDRYGGVYSRHSFTAWAGERPDEIDAGDSTCQNYWAQNRVTAVYGGGETPQAALADLLKKLGHWVGEYDLIDIEEEYDKEKRFIPVTKKRMEEWYPEMASDF